MSMKINRKKRYVKPMMKVVPMDEEAHMIPTEVPLHDLSSLINKLQDAE